MGRTSQTSFTSFPPFFIKTALPIHSGSVHIRELDQSGLFNGDGIMSLYRISLLVTFSSRGPIFRLTIIVPIYSADTIYPAPGTHVAHPSCSPSHRFPPIFLCIERRDSLLVDCFLGDAQNIWHFNVERIPHKKQGKALQRSGMHWSRADWEDVELWKLKLDLYTFQSF